MSEITNMIPKQPALQPAEDFYLLRREGIGFIAQNGSRAWTDYNTHDPGITILEALCYAITDLAYRMRWDIQDILTPATAPADLSQPYPNQTFFSARQILTVNPTTPDDVRRLLIDQLAVRNAWVVCKQCACELSYYAWCDKDELVMSYEPPADNTLDAELVSVRGLYEALLELEADTKSGDLNDRKIERTSVLHDDNGAHSSIMELRFPDFGLLHGDQWELFLSSNDAFKNDHGASFDLALTQLGATPGYDVFSDPALDEAGRDAYVRRHWRDLFYLTFEITLNPSSQKISIEAATLRLFGDVAIKMATTAKGLKAILEDKTPAGFVQRYRDKAKLALSAIEDARKTLLDHRNLDEDYCTVEVVGVEEIAVCADVEVRPDADIELVQAHIWFRIEQYLNPPIRFYALQELLDEGVAVEDVFNGPALDSGFVKSGELQAAALKTVLRVSDIVNSLMDIDGVIAVNQLSLAKYGADGELIKGAADPLWVAGDPVFDATKESAFWLMFMSPRHQPRLYLNLSRFLFYKSGLPFLPRMDEAVDTLQQLRGQAERPKNRRAATDLSIPKGRYRNPESYYPVQYSFPAVYGTGPAGLPAHASQLRRAQARQLKAYLMVFEQVLGNALAQLAHAADLFSTDPAISRTYFGKTFTKDLIQGFDDIANGLDDAALAAILETPSEFEERRNRFLDHLLARFGEQFGEYALLMTKLNGKRVALRRLIDDKLSFLASYPAISHDRGKAFNYAVTPGPQQNDPGIKKRISLLLGYPNLTFGSTAVDLGGGQFRVQFKLTDPNKKIWLQGETVVTAGDTADAIELGYRLVIGRMVLLDAYVPIVVANQFRLTLQDTAGARLAEDPELLDIEAQAIALRDEFIAWSANERLIVVEHLLLRPKFPGDALYPACSDGGCSTCGDEDPYSFRLTFVMPGWTRAYADNLDMRRFAERTIQQGTPSHLLAKICWVGNEGVIENPCDEIVGELAQLLIAESQTAAGVAPDEEQACACALSLHRAFSSVFSAWYEDKVLDYYMPEALDTLVTALFSNAPKPQDFALSCSAVLETELWKEIRTRMVRHFSQIALFGWQFERFEAAWGKWLRVNARIDWTEQRLHERVQAILEHGRTSDVVDKEKLCECAMTILREYGMAFYNWMVANLKSGLPFGQFPPFDPPTVAICPDIAPHIAPGTAQAIRALLTERYHRYEEVSYRLWVVVNLLSKLRNVYPGATLHDCDEGSDENPVRLNSTALGNHTLRTSLT